MKPCERVHVRDAREASSDQRSRSARLARAMLRRLPLIGTILGLTLALWLIATNDMAAIGSAFGRIGLLGLAAVVLVRALILALCGLAWARILDGLSRAETAAFLFLRCVREGINVLLPVASVGGEVVGARLLTFWGVTGSLAAASILADMLIQVVTEIAFTVTGVVLLRRLESAAAASLAGWALDALLIAVALVFLFFLLQRSGAMRLVERGLLSLARQVAGPSGALSGPTDEKAGIQASLDTVWGGRRYGHLSQSLLLHLAAWFLGAAEIWIALHFIGIEIGITDAIVLESLSQAIKSAAFPVPSGLGVQEGSFVMVGALFGIDAGTAIALSLVKRVPDVVLGLPSLIIWQTLEARRADIMPAPPHNRSRSR